MAKLSSKNLSLFAFFDYIYNMNRFYLLGLVAVFMLAGCEKDFQVTAPYKDVTLVYGVIDPLDTAHYIRIQKAFLDENKSAIEMSKIPDSNYFDSLSVKLQEYNNTTLKSETALMKVDMNLEGYRKDPPANSQGFFTSPNYGYKFKKVLDPFLKYRVIINNPNTGKNDTSEFFRVINTDSSRGQNKFYITAFANIKYEIDFAKTALPGHMYSLIGTKPLNGSKFEAKLRFHYVDKNVMDGTETPKSADMYIDAKANTNPENTSYTIETHNKSFYSFLRDEIGLPGANIARYMGKVDVWVYAGSQELANYEAITNAQSNGLTGDQIKPHYTTMKSRDALGIIGSRSFRLYENATLSDNTIDSLIINELTAPLNIKGRAQ